MSTQAPFALPAYNWRPRQDQLRVWNGLVAPEFTVADIVAHRRWGKDELMLQALAVHAMRRVGSYWYALPEYEQARKAIWTMVNWRTQRTRIADAFPPEIVTKTDNEGMHLTLASGSTVQLVGSDRVDSLVGGGQIGIVVSEAALSRPEFMMYVQPILEESGGWMARISTPRGKNHFHKSYLGTLADMRAGRRGAIAAYMPAGSTAVFSPAQLLRIRMELIRQHGHTIGEAMYEQEYECSFEAAIVGAVWGQELTDLSMQGRVRPQPHDRRFPVLTSWDIGVADPTVILFWQEIGGMYRLIDGHEETSIGLDTYVEVLRAKHNTLGYRYATHYGPHDIQQREWVRGLSRKDEAKRLGLEFKRTPQTRVKTQISAGAQLINAMVVNSESEGAMAALERFKSYKYPKVQQNGVQSEAPVHDDASHASSALMTYAINKAAALGLGSQVLDDQLNGATGIDDLGGGEKFDPRQFGNGRVPFGSENSVSSQMRGYYGQGGNPSRGAFG